MGRRHPGSGRVRRAALCRRRAHRRRRRQARPTSRRRGRFGCPTPRSATPRAIRRQRRLQVTDGRRPDEDDFDRTRREPVLPGPSIQNDGAVPASFKVKSTGAATGYTRHVHQLRQRREHHCRGEERNASRPGTSRRVRAFALKMIVKLSGRSRQRARSSSRRARRPARRRTSSRASSARPRRLPGHNVRVARILLGITGGIAAYKACELVRLLVKAGHDVLPLPTRGAERFVSAETFFALARKTLGHRPVSAPGARRPARDRAADGEHAREARARPRRRRPHRGRARAPGPRARRAGDEHAHVGARGDAGERGHAAGTRGRADRPRGGRARRGRGRARPDERAGRRSRARVEALLGRKCCFNTKSARGRAACSSAPAGRASRSTPSASSATAPRAGWASRSPSRRSAAARR